MFLARVLVQARNFDFWASSGLAQASRFRPSESLQRLIVAGLAQATTPSLSKTVVVA